MLHPARLILSPPEARAAGLRLPLTNAVRITEAARFDDILREAAHAGRPAALVLIRGNREKGWVEVWQHGQPITHTQRYQKKFKSHGSEPSLLRRKRKTTA